MEAKIIARHTPDTVEKRYKRSKKSNLVFDKIIPYILLAVLAVVLVFPYFYMLMRSLMSHEEVSDPVLRLFPAVPQFVNYVKLFTQNNYFKATLNTLFIIVFNSFAICLSASIIAFSFAKLEWIGKKFMFAAMLGTIMLPGIATQIPLYVMYSKFRWIDTFWPFTIPNLFGGSAIYIFLMRQFMQGIPKEMDNAAKIDGAGPLRRWWLIFPLCKPILIYLLVNIFVGNWGDYYGPLIFMPGDEAPRTLAYLVFLDSLQENAATYNANLRMAGGVFMSVFPTILFFIFQRQLIEGVATTGLKA